MPRLVPRRARFGVLLLSAAVVAVTAAIAHASGPQGNWVAVASGKVGDYQWSVKLRRPANGPGADQAGARRTCLLVGATWPVGRYSFSRVKARQCSGGSGRLVASEPPLIAAGAQPSDGGSAKVTAVGMLVGPKARRVRVTLANGSEKTIHLQRLSRGSSRLAGLGALRYTAFVIHGSWCAERLVTEDAAGRTLWDSGIDGYACSR
jgi:hypothetical protein